MEKKCHQAGCKVLETGICMDGEKKENCSMFYIDDESNAVPDEESTKGNNISTHINLNTGEELSYLEISRVTNRYDAKVIFIIGESESGKTTLLAEFFANFQKQPLGEFTFAGSLTQVGFEERVFLSTLASEGVEPRTPRTTSRDFTFLHLAIKNLKKAGSDIQHLLLSDVYGEIYREAKFSSSLMQKLKLIRSADHTLFIIDGEKLASNETWALALDDAKKFITRALDEGIFDNTTTLTIAVSKWDLLCNSSSFSFENQVEKSFNAKFSGRLKKIKYLQIAARPSGSGVKNGLGLENLLIDWTTEEEYLPPSPFIERAIDNRHFNSFKFQIK